MTEPDDEPTLEEDLPDDLLEAVDELDAPALHQFSVYVSDRLNEFSRPLEEMIRDEAKGEIVDIEDRGAYSLVRKRPQSHDDVAAGSGEVSVYHVRRKREADGSETLHWSFIGDLND